MGILAIITVVLGFVSVLFFALLLTFAIYYRREEKTRLDPSFFRVCFLGVVFLIALVIRLACIFAVADFDKFDESFFESLKTIYYTIAGFGFEGQDYGLTNFDAAHLIAAFFYFASLLWMAITFVLIVTIGLSYELYSKLLIRFNKSKEVFIFAFVTKDSILLADDIRKNKPDALIIFAGDELGKFDKEDELHQKIKGRKYSYISLYKPMKPDWGVPLIKRLHLLGKGRKYHIFAFKNNKDEKGLESENSDIVFDDIRYGLRDAEYTKMVIDNDVIEDINYYILSNTSLNFEFYDKKLNELFIEEYYEKLPEGEKPTLEQIKTEPKKYDGGKDKVRRAFKIYLVNEAELVGFNLMEKRHKLLQEEELKEGEEYIINNTSNQKHTAVVLGFGQTGQTVLNMLYVDSSAIDRKIDKKYGLFKPYKFEAHVYDENIGNVSGVFEKSHPSYLFVKKFDNQSNKEQIINLHSLMKAYGQDVFDFVDKYLGFPKIYLYQQNANSLELLEDIDVVTPTAKEEVPSKWRDDDFIIIATGSDDRNINIANTILQDIRQEVYSNDVKPELRSPIEIYVNIRDGNNKERLRWNEELEKIRHPWIKVIAFGFDDQIYSYNSIVLHKEKELQALYDVASGYDPDYKKYITPYQQYANKMADLFSDYYDRYIYAYKNGVLTDDDKNYLTQLEHQRWSRALIAIGGLYIKHEMADKLEKDNESFFEYSFAYANIFKYSKEMLFLNTCLAPAYSKELEKLNDKNTIYIDFKYVVYDENNSFVYPGLRRDKK